MITLIPNLDLRSHLSVQTTFLRGRELATIQNTDDPSVFLTLSDFRNKPSPKKRNIIVSERLASEENEDEVTTAEGTVERADNEEDDLGHGDLHLTVPMRFEQIEREADVKTFTGLPSTKCFKCTFDQLFLKSRHM